MTVENREDDNRDNSFNNSDYDYSNFNYNLKEVNNEFDLKYQDTLV